MQLESDPARIDLCVSMCCHIQDQKTYQDREAPFFGIGSNSICVIVSVFLVSVHKGSFLLSLLFYVAGAGDQRVLRVDGRGDGDTGVWGKGSWLAAIQWKAFLRNLCRLRNDDVRENGWLSGKAWECI